jgi:alpha-tubulin suppressor-like RCC1 family protein
MGGFHGCVRTIAGTVRCWGSNFEGQLGDCSSNDAPSPVAALGIDSVSSLALGNVHSCASRSDGSLWCWGDNFHWQLGPIPVDAPHSACLDSMTASNMSVFAPTPVPMLDHVAGVAAGAFHTCALRSDGSVTCFGNDLYGQAAYCGGNDVMVPRTIPSLQRVTSIAAGANHTCAVSSDERVLCWGDNQRGQLGDGTRVSSSNPVLVRW